MESDILIGPIDKTPGDVQEEQKNVDISKSGEGYFPFKTSRNAFWNLAN